MSTASEGSTVAAMESTDEDKRFIVNHEGGISDDVAHEIVESIRVVPNFPKPVSILSPRLHQHTVVHTVLLCYFCHVVAIFAASFERSRTCVLTTSPLSLLVVQHLNFKDLSLLMANPKAFGGVIDALVSKYSKRDITAVAGIGAPHIHFAISQSSITRGTYSNQLAYVCERGYSKGRVEREWEEKGRVLERRCLRNHTQKLLKTSTRREKCPRETPRAPRHTHHFYYDSLCDVDLWHSNALMRTHTPRTHTRLTQTHRVPRVLFCGASRNSSQGALHTDEKAGQAAK